MPHQSPEALLESFGVNIRRGAVFAIDAISADSPILPQAESMLVGLIGKYPSVRKWIEAGMNSPADASEEYAADISRAMKDVEGWRKGDQVHPDLIYVSKTLERRLDVELQTISYQP